MICLFFIKEIEISERLIYHFTHIKNITSILKSGGLHCKSTMVDFNHKEVGNNIIKYKRKRRKVTVPPYGVVTDYVPFYFAPRSPMLEAIYDKKVPNYTAGQEDLVYIVAQAKEAFIERKCCFTDRNATRTESQFFSNFKYLDTKIDWDIMRISRCENTPEDSERVARRMAEFLVFEYFPWPLVEDVVAYDRSKVAYVRRVFFEHGVGTQVTACRNWYF